MRGSLHVLTCWPGCMGTEHGRKKASGFGEEMETRKRGPGALQNGCMGSLVISSMYPGACHSNSHEAGFTCFGWGQAIEPRQNILDSENALG